jgi:hypothetical protein
MSWSLDDSNLASLLLLLTSALSWSLDLKTIYIAAALVFIRTSIQFETSNTISSRYDFY